VTQPASPQGLDDYARSGARLAGLTIEDSWWPEIVRHLTVLIEQARLVEHHVGSRELVPAPSFKP
jgi:hypothetical protein